MGAETVPTVCVGTAGHVDHGKTWLVRALTGKDTDRLPDEKRRGISIDLGYAPLDLPDGRRLSLIDVPGHERFVRNMVAGATGIDLFLLVVDAGEGPREQTREHLAILRLLGIERGVVAVTKSDTAEPAAVARTIEASTELVPTAEALAVSAKTGAGLEELRDALCRAASDLDRDRENQPTRLFVDRVFTLRGAGTVATGTLWSGSVGEGDVLRAEPRGLDVRVRSLQVHDEPVDRAGPGRRVAVALPGIERSALSRGDALVQPGAYPVSYRLDVALAELEPIEDGARLLAHHGTAEVPVQVKRIGERYAQLRLASPIVGAHGDRVILRAETTVGGATVLDPQPPRHSDETRLERLERGESAEVIQEPVRRNGEWVVPDDWVDRVRADVHAFLADHASRNPLDPGLAPAALRPEVPSDLLPLLGLEARDGKVFLPGSRPDLGAKSEQAAALVAAVSEAAPNAVEVADPDVARYLESEGRLVRLGPRHAISSDAYERARATVIEECERAGSITLARFRDLLGISRRPAQLLLERLDTDGLTLRRGDERILRRSALRR